MEHLGFKFFSGVPCSFLKYLINYAINHLRYIAAANEGDAVAIAAGAYIGGMKSVVLMQNSGLTNALSPLSSLIYPFQIPLLGFVSLRGEESIQDEPQHELMGKVTVSLLEKMGISWEFLSTDFLKAGDQLKRASHCIENNESFFFIIKKGTFQEEILTQQTIPDARNCEKIIQSGPCQLPTRVEALKAINGCKDRNTVLLATTGLTGRELYEIDDAENNLYLVGSMGCVSSLGLGLALARPQKEIIAIDGDGSLIMRMGSLATNAAYHPSNMLHILLDNNIHDSTGGQDTAAKNINFVEIAASCGYQRALYAHNLSELTQQIHLWKKRMALTFLYLKIRPGSPKYVGRPKAKPVEVKNRLMLFLER